MQNGLAIKSELTGLQEEKIASFKPFDYRAEMAQSFHDNQLIAQAKQLKSLLIKIMGSFPRVKQPCSNYGSMVLVLLAPCLSFICCSISHGNAGWK